MNRIQYILYRSMVTIFLLWLVLTFLFVLFRLMPGDISDIMLAQGIPRPAVEEYRRVHGLDKPLLEQYQLYLVNFLQGKAGTSLQTRTPVVPYVTEKVINSAILAGPGITVGYIGGTILGVMFGNNRGSRFEKYGVSTIMFIGRLPDFFLAILFIIIFSGWLGWFPSGGMLSIEALQQTPSGQPFWKSYLSVDFALHYVLPFSVVAIKAADTPSILMRTSVVEVRNQDFFEYLRLTGLKGQTKLKHLARHASLPVVTLYPIAMTRAIGGLVLIETVFNWPGVGFALVEGVLYRDFPVIQFMFFAIAAFVILANFVVDITYSWIDPRVIVGSSD